MNVNFLDMAGAARESVSGKKGLSKPKGDHSFGKEIASVQKGFERDAQPVRADSTRTHHQDEFHAKGGAGATERDVETSRKPHQEVEGSGEERMSHEVPEEVYERHVLPIQFPDANVQAVPQQLSEVTAGLMVPEEKLLLQDGAESKVNVRTDAAQNEVLLSKIPGEVPVVSAKDGAAASDQTLRSHHLVDEHLGEASEKRPLEFQRPSSDSVTVRPEQTQTTVNPARTSSLEENLLRFAEHEKVHSERLRVPHEPPVIKGEQNGTPVIRENGDVRMHDPVRTASLEENLLRFADHEKGLSERLRVPHEPPVIKGEQDGTPVIRENGDVRMHDPARTSLLEENLLRFAEHEKRLSEQQRSLHDSPALKGERIGTPDGRMDVRMYDPARSSSLEQNLLRFAEQEPELPGRLRSPEDTSSHTKSLAGTEFEKPAAELQMAQAKASRGYEMHQVWADRSQPVHDLSGQVVEEHFSIPADRAPTGPEGTVTITAAGKIEELSYLMADKEKVQGVLDQVLSKLRVMTAKGKERITLQLYPENLGKLRMHLSIQNHRVVAEIMTDTQVARDLLSNNVHTLKEALADQGLRLEKFEIHLQQEALENGFAHSGQAFRESSEQEENGFSEQRNEGVEEPEQSLTTSTVSALAGNVNLFA